MKKKSLSVAKKAKTELNFQKIYKIFKSNISKKISKKNFAVAVSGGPDSLCLSYLSKKYGDEFGNKIRYLIVDHKLRKESSKEALFVKKLLKQNKIQANILTYKGKKPLSNVQSKAREIRYNLISQECVKDKLRYLLTAHHEDDQVENFFIRLSRGSGLLGLSSMNESSKFLKNVVTLRPLLSFKKKDLEKITKEKFTSFVRDPSNQNEKYLRIRIRKMRKLLFQQGLDTNKVIRTIENLKQSKEALDFYVNKAKKKYTKILKQKAFINKSIFENEADAIIYSVFSRIFLIFGKLKYPPRSKKIVFLLKNLKFHRKKKMTLGGCVFNSDMSKIVVTREKKRS